MNLQVPGIATFETETILWFAHALLVNCMIYLVVLAPFHPFHPFAQFHSPFPILVFTLFHLIACSKVLYDYMSECEHTAPPLLWLIFVHVWCILKFDRHCNTISDKTTFMENKNTNSVSDKIRLLQCEVMKGMKGVHLNWCLCTTSSYLWPHSPIQTSPTSSPSKAH